MENFARSITKAETSLNLYRMAAAEQETHNVLAAMEKYDARMSGFDESLLIIRAYKILAEIHLKKLARCMHQSDVLFHTLVCLSAISAVKHRCTFVESTHNPNRMSKLSDLTGSFELGSTENLEALKGQIEETITKEMKDGKMVTVITTTTTKAVPRPPTVPYRRWIHSIESKLTGLVKGVLKSLLNDNRHFYVAFPYAKLEHNRNPLNKLSQLVVEMAENYLEQFEFETAPENTKKMFVSSLYTELSHMASPIDPNVVLQSSVDESEDSGMSESGDESSESEDSPIDDNNNRGVDTSEKRRYLNFFDQLRTIVNIEKQPAKQILPKFVIGPKSMLISVSRCLGDIIKGDSLGAYFNRDESRKRLHNDMVELCIKYKVPDVVFIHAYLRLGCSLAAGDDFHSGLRLIRKCRYLFQSYHSSANHEDIALCYLKLGKYQYTKACTTVPLLDQMITTSQLLMKDKRHHSKPNVDSEVSEMIEQAIKSLNRAYRIMLATSPVSRMQLKIGLYLGKCYFLVGKYQLAVDKLEKSFEVGLKIPEESSASFRVQNTETLILLTLLNLVVERPWKVIGAAACVKTLMRASLDDGRSFKDACWLVITGLALFHTEHDIIQAMSCCRRALEIFHRACNDNIGIFPMKKKWVVLVAIYVIAASLFTIGRYTDAQKQLELCRLKLLDFVVGENCDDNFIFLIIKVSNKLGDICKELGSEDQALQYYDEAISYGEFIDKLSSAKFMQSEMLAKSADVYMRQNRTDEAAECMKKSTSILSDMSEQLDENVTELIYEMALVELGNGKIDTCLDYFLQVYAEYMRARSVVSPRTFASLASNIGMLQWSKTKTMGSDTLGKMSRKRARQVEDLFVSAEMFLRESTRHFPSATNVAILGMLLCDQGSPGKGIELISNVENRVYNEEYVTFTRSHQSILPYPLQMFLDNDSECTVLLSLLIDLMYVVYPRTERERTEHLMKIVETTIELSDSLEALIIGYSLSICGLFDEAGYVFALASDYFPEIDFTYLACYTMLLDAVTSFHKGVKIFLRDKRDSDKRCIRDILRWL